MVSRAGHSKNNVSYIIDGVYSHHLLFAANNMAKNTAEYLQWEVRM